MADEWKEYVNDPRTVCKYGAKCYQKNPEHHQKFKHPSQNTRKDVHRNKRRFSPYTRDSPRHSPNPRKDKPPSGGSEDLAVKDGNDSKEKTANVDSNDSKEKTANVDSNDSKEKTANVDSNDSKEKTADDDSNDSKEKTADDDSNDSKEKTADDDSNDSKEKTANDDSNENKEKTANDDSNDSKEKTANDDSNDSKKKTANDDSDDKSEHPEIPKPEREKLKAVKLPENITFHDKSTDNSLLKELFLVEMPTDFFKFFECISDCGKSVEDTLARVNLMPIGPYELLLGKLPQVDNKELYLTHWRFFYDPPEFQAVLKKKRNSEYHMGYFRDDPDEKPVFVASNDSEKGYHITPMAQNIFGAVYVYLQNEKKHSPFTAMSCQKLMDNIKAYAEKNNISLEEFSMKKRLPHMVTRSFHGAGIVVPYNKKTQLGYRHLVETDANLKKLFASLEKARDQNEKDKLLSDLQPVITYASIAVDECDFGTGLEVGIALFCSGLKELEPSAMNSLTAAYSVLNRSSFGEIIQAHLKYRRKGPNVSLLHLK